jgi:hypothetical protein
LSNGATHNTRAQNPTIHVSIPSKSCRDLLEWVGVVLGRRFWLGRHGDRGPLQPTAIHQDGQRAQLPEFPGAPLPWRTCFLCLFNAYWWLVDLLVVCTPVAVAGVLSSFWPHWSTCRHRSALVSPLATLPHAPLAVASSFLLSFTCISRVSRPSGARFSRLVQQAVGVVITPLRRRPPVAQGGQLRLAPSLVP